MNGQAWTDEETQKLFELSGQGYGLTDIAQRLKRSKHSIFNKLKRHRETKPAKRRVEKSVLDSFEESSSQTRIRLLESEVQRLKSSGPRVVPELSDDWDGAKEWQRAEVDAKRRIERAEKVGRFSVNFQGPVGISFISDQHIAPGTPVDFERMRIDAELVRDTPGFYAVLAGDGVDNHIKHRPAILAARSQPDDQYKLFDHYLGIFGEKVLAVISGNHDAWTNAFAGVDMLGRVVEANRVCYAPDEAMLTVKVGKCDYALAVRHQYRFNSAFNQTHSVKQWYNFGEQPFDVGCIAHHHEHAIEQFVRHGARRWACRPGSYQIHSKYSRQFGFNRTYPSCPTFILFPDERRIIGFGDLQDAVDAWEGLKP